MEQVNEMVASLILDEKDSATNIQVMESGHGTDQAKDNEDTCKKLMIIFRTPLDTDFLPRPFARQYTSNANNVKKTHRVQNKKMTCVVVSPSAGHGWHSSLPNTCW
jgi:hypothetical protein|tara:strand:+ start:713 stop:1030 length:318 start_codon:yes stop_codon:yes gene_type:complete